jgi:fimbrial chaperone protein
MTVFSRALMIACLTLPQMAQAAALRISPIGVEMTDAEKATSISLKNTDIKPVALQVRVFKWTQAGGEDKLEPTTEVIVSPPATTVPAGATYTIRVARPSVAPVTRELAYRVFIDELPPPIDPENPAKGVSMVLRTSMPIFVAREKAKPQLSWRVRPVKDGIEVGVANAGDRNVKITNLTLKDASGKEIATGAGLNGYVLAGTDRTFTLTASSKSAPPLTEGATVSIHATNRSEEIDQSAVVGRP